eukprot:COSAG02_NODE_2659_length_8310_cov_10.600901_6_plen_242_part_00
MAEPNGKSALTARADAVSACSPRETEGSAWRQRVAPRDDLLTVGRERAPDAHAQRSLGPCGAGIALRRKQRCVRTRQHGPTSLRVKEYMLDSMALHLTCAVAWLCSVHLIMQRNAAASRAARPVSPARMAGILIRIATGASHPPCPAQQTNAKPPRALDPREPTTSRTGARALAPPRALPRPPPRARVPAPSATASRTAGTVSRVQAITGGKGHTLATGASDPVLVAQLTNAKAPHALASS